MNTQTITWTALPNGVTALVDGIFLKLSVFASPRLTSDDKNATLAQFPDFLDWPETLFPSAGRRQIIFSVQFGSNPHMQAYRQGDEPSSDLWRYLFDENTPLENFEFSSFKNRPIQSYPVKNINSFLKDQYINLATTSGEQFPSADELVRGQRGPFHSLAFTLRENAQTQLEQEILNSLSRHKFVNPGSTSNPEELAKSFLMAKMFHQPFSTKRINIKPPVIDFHRAVSLLGDYPYLLRRLGLVHDLLIPLPMRILPENTVQVFATWMSRDSSFKTTNIPSGSKTWATRCWVDSKSFYALPRASDSDLDNGQLTLDNSRKFEVLHIDPDSAAIKTLNFTGSVGMARSLRKTDDTPEEVSLPAMRSTGISVAKINRAQAVHESFDRQETLNDEMESSTPTLLDAEDITRGYAIDVWDSQTKNWHSLCQRIGTYTFSRPQPPFVEKAEDEGFISMAMTSAADESSDIMRLGEQLFTWQGWSLVAPRPGKALDENGLPQKSSEQIDPSFEFSASFTPKPGSLPRLRYGVSYSLRARAVDLAGNCLDLHDRLLAEKPHVTPELVYGRLDPVPPPVVVMRHRRTEGDSVEHLVIRSNYDQPIERVTERHIVPPKTSQTMAESHGLFDDPRNGLVDRNAYDAIVPREGGIITGTPDELNNNQPYVDKDKLELPYLPDVFSKQAAFQGLPRVNGPFTVDFGYDEGTVWPDALPFRLLLGENDTPEVYFDKTSRVLEVLLPKAEVVKVRLSSALHKDDTAQMGLIAWIIESGQDATLAVAQAVQGRHWMLTPYRTLTLVHAVRQPLLTPEFDQLFVSRNIGQTFASVSDRVMRISRKSTVKVDILASWQEPVDVLGEPAPRTIQVAARPFDFPVTQAKDTAEEETFYVHGDHEFGDTKYRRVTYSAVATTRFAEYFTQRQKDVKLAGSSPYSLSKEGIVESSEAVSLADKSATFKRYDAAGKSGDYVVDYTAGTIRRTTPAEASSAIPENSALEVSYIAPPITRETVKPRELDVLSSARPAAPRVLYAVPAFGWETIPSGRDFKTITSTRTGGIVRIYLERPWFSSGEGELLGAVIWPGPSSISISSNPAHEKIKPFVTQWGLDPLFYSGPIRALPTLQAFKLSKREHQASGLLLAEVPDAALKIDVAGHEVNYDAERQLWYCDMQIDAGNTYYPFVRLALVRYQPNSLSWAVTGPDTVVDHTRDNVHLSPVILADFIQLTPDRFASITRDDANPLLRHISVSGLSYRVLGGKQGTAVMEAGLEKQRSGIDVETAGELAWESVAGSTITLAPDHDDKTSGGTVWRGDIKVPNGTDTFRLVIKEFEQYPIPSTIAVITQRRMVYADTIVLAP
jgi:hypothetical protein